MSRPCRSTAALSIKKKTTSISSCIEFFSCFFVNFVSPAYNSKRKFDSGLDQANLEDTWTIDWTVTPSIKHVRIEDCCVFFLGLLASRQPIGGGNLLDGGPMAMRSTLSKLLAQAKTVALARHEKLTACLSVALIPPAVQ